MTTDSDKLDSLINLLTEATKKDTGVSLHRSEDITLGSYVPYGIPTNLPQLDLALRCDGWPAGRLIEIYGSPLAGKSTIAYHAVEGVQSLGGSALWIDVENTFDPDRARECGADPNNMKVAEAYTVEAIFRVIEKTLDGLQKIKYDRPFLIVVDSVTAVTTEYEAGRDFTGEQRTGHEAKQIRGGAKRVTAKAAKAKVPIMFINHGISKIGGYGKQTQAAGGNALKFWGSLRVEVRPKSTISMKDSNDIKIVLGKKIAFDVEKVKGRSLQRPGFDANLLNDKGFDRIQSLYDAMETIGLISHSTGSRKSTIYPGTKQETQFLTAKWDEVINEFGGYKEVYKHFIEHATALDEIRPWGVSIEEESDAQDD